MDPVKYAIYLEINNKCSECKDLTFCKLPSYYHRLENVRIQDLINLKKCVFYNRKPVKIESLVTWL